MPASQTLPRTLIVSPDWIAAQTLADWLTPDEIARAQQFPSPARQRDWLAGRLAAKRLLWETWGVPPLSCTVGSDGLAPCLDAPGLENVNWSLSHSHGWGASSWADTESEGTAGIDIQHIRPVHPGLAARILSDKEQAHREELGHIGTDTLLLIWALKEAAIKARREPWGRALRLVNVRITGDNTAQITLPGEQEPFAATWARAGEFWVARAVKPPPRLLATLVAP